MSINLLLGLVGCVTDVAKDWFDDTGEVQDSSTNDDSAVDSQDSSPPVNYTDVVLSSNEIDIFKLSGEGSHDYAGAALAIAENATGDSSQDILIGAPSLNSSGVAYLVEGGISRDQVLYESGSTTLEGEHYYARAGESVATGEHTTHNGISDLVVGSPNYNNGNEREAGAVYLFHDAVEGDTNLSQADFQIQSDDSYDHFGSSVAVSSNFYGYGIWVGAPGDVTYGDGESAAYYFRTVYGTSPASLENAEMVLSAESLDDEVGASVASGDINGDGQDDVIIGAPSESTNSGGAAYLVYGGRDYNEMSLADADTKWISEAAGDALGETVTIVDDVNGDGRNDVVLSAPNYGQGAQSYGAVYLVQSDPGGRTDVGRSEIRIQGEGNFDRFGFSASTAGDVDADGLSDLLIGAPFAADEAGAAYLIYGDLTAGDYTVSDLAALRFVGEAERQYAGYAVIGGTDVTGDDIGDVVIGAPGGNDGVFVLSGTLF